jgi:hypothetical protein
MRLTNTGNLLIGETSLSNAAGWDTLVQIYATNYPALSLKNAYRQWDVAVNGSSGTLRFYDVTAGSDRMNIDASGNLLVGTTSAPFVKSSMVVANGYAARDGESGSFSGNVFNINWTGNPFLWIDSTNIGQLATVSDYRLKENIALVSSNAINRVMQLNPIQFNRKKVGMFGGSSEVEEGFLAHELQAVIPSSVHGEKDALTEDGGIQPQSLNWSPIVATLVKAIQEQQAMIQSLTDRISQLEAK